MNAIDFNCYVNCKEIHRIEGALQAIENEAY